ncbi:MAG: regulatory iron-sulfur-containing complex subunit RicT [Acidobacteriota bacterium]
MNVQVCPVVDEPRRRLIRLCFTPDLPGQVCTVADAVSVEEGMWCVVATPDGERVGQVETFRVPVLPTCCARAVGTVVRAASEADVERTRELVHLERDALSFCRVRAAELGLAMRPVTAIVPLDRDVLIVTFAAEERVDFRELLRDLGRRTRRRVELRQIGVRDQARASGGWGPCGRTLCCSTFMARFASVTIRMAKAQNLSLSPSRISGMCGRLMCCLAHEAPEAAARSPRQDAPR